MAPSPMSQVANTRNEVPAIQSPFRIPHSQGKARTRAGLSLHRCYTINFDSLVRELQPLLRPFVNAIKGLLQVVHRVGDAEAQIAFAVGAECRSGESCYAGLIKNSVGQF